MKIFVVGHGRHGKDEFCESFQKLTGLTFSSSSWEVAHLIYPVIKDRYGYGSIEECYERRHEPGLREVWYKFIREYNKEDETRLSKCIFSKHDIYCGIREVKELIACRRKQLCDLIIWIDASERMPAEPSSSMTITKYHADVIIDNNTTLQDFHDRIREFAKLFTQ